MNSRETPRNSRNAGEGPKPLAADAGDGLVPGGEAGGAHGLVEGGQEAVFALAQASCPVCMSRKQPVP